MQSYEIMLPLRIKKLYSTVRDMTMATINKDKYLVRKLGDTFTEIFGLIDLNEHNKRLCQYDNLRQTCLMKSGIITMFSLPVSNEELTNSFLELQKP